MSRAYHIIRLTFWFNNLQFVLLAVLTLCTFSNMPWVNTRPNSEVLIGAVVLLIGSWIAEYGILFKKYDVGPMQLSRHPLDYFAEDERERAIAKQVHEKVMRQYMCWFFLLFAVVLFLSQMPTWLPLIFILVWSFAAILINCQYFYWWQQLDTAD
jgi:hypothetical protein